MTIHRINITQGGGVSAASAGNSMIESLDGVPRYLPISSDGRYVLFQSEASDLLPGDDPEHPRPDVFLYDQQTGLLERIGRDVLGEADINSAAVSVSTDGRYITFRSYDQITPESGPDGAYLYVYDRQLKTTEMVDIGPMQADAQATLQQHLTSYRTMSGDARFVYFTSERDDVVAGDTNGKLDAFLLDRQTGAATRISVKADGSQFDGDARAVDMSADGSYLILRTDTPDGREASFWFKDMTTGELTAMPALAENWRIAGDGRTLVAFGGGKIQVIDLETGETSLLFSNLGTLLASDVAVSGDGRFVTFRSTASHVVSGDTNNLGDYFVHDRQTGQTARVNVTPEGGQSNGSLPALEGVAISDDGKWITFLSTANDLDGGASGLIKAFVASNPFLDVPDLRYPNYVIGGEGDNTLVGTVRHDMIEALNGDDTVAGGGGDDVIFGRQGDDDLQGEAGRDTVFGHEGADTVAGGTGRDLLIGGEDDDDLRGGEDGDVLVGDAEGLDAMNGADTLSGDVGEDSLYGGGGDDVLRGGDHDDDLVGGGGADSLDGGAGEDSFVLDRGDDTIVGGEGHDTLYITSSAGDYVIEDRLASTSDGADDYTAISGANTGSDVVSGVERAAFTTLRTNVAAAENKYVTLAKAADNAYENAPTPVEGWKNITALELGMELAGSATTPAGVDYAFTFANGVYSATSTLPGGAEIEAVATIQFAVVDGRDTLMISFRGTDQAADVLDYFPFGMHYDKFEPFLAAVHDYIENNGYASQGQLDQVWVSGHSLGGAMAQMFMQDARFSSSLFSGATFGSPGAELHEPDARLLHFEHSGDMVPYAGDVARAQSGMLSNYISFGLSDDFVEIALQWVRGDPTDFQTSGGVIRTVTDTGPDLLAQHSMSNYLPTVEKFAAQAQLLPFMRGDGAYRLAPGSHADINVGGAEGDVLVGATVAPVMLLRGSDYFRGDELFIGGGGGDVITGGLGTDVFLGTVQDLHLDRISDLSGGEAIRVSGVSFSASDVVYTAGEGGGVLRVSGAEIWLQGSHPGLFTVHQGSEYTEVRYSGAVGLDGGGGDDVLAGGQGDDVIVGRDGNDRVSGGDGNDHLHGDAGPPAANARAFTAGAGGTGGDDFLEGGAGDDHLYAGGGNDIVDGGLDADVLHLSGAREDYLVVLRRDAPDQIQLIDLREGSPDGHDHVTNVERFDFGGSGLSLAELANTGPVDYAPELLGETISISAQAGARSIDVLANDIDPDEGDSLDLVEVLAGGTRGVASLGPDGQLRYEPGAAFADLAPGQVSYDLVRYVVKDDQGAVSTAAVTVIVFGPRTGPVAVDDEVAVREGEPTELAVLLLANDQQAEGQDTEDRKIVEVNASATKGDVVFDPLTGKLTYTAGEAFLDLKPGEFGEDLLTYVLENADGLRTEATVSIRVEGVLTDSEWDSGTEGADLMQGEARPDALRGLGGGDTLVGAGAGDWLSGDADNDLVSGEDGNDTLWGGTGDDTLDGGVGGDLIEGGEGADILIAGPGNPDHGVPIEVIDGGAGFDTALIDHTDVQLSPRYRYHGAKFVLSETGEETTERSSSEVWGWQVRLRNVEQVDWTGSAWDDQALGGRYGDTLSGGVGEDQLAGRAGDDLLRGGADHDVLVGGSGDDTLSGGAGSDNLSGDHHNDSWDSAPIEERFSSSTFNDYLDGGDGGDGLSGGRGDDTLVGGAGIDFLEGGSGDDVAVIDGARENYALVSIAGYGGKYALVDQRAGPLGVNYDTGEWPETLTDGFDIVGEDVEWFEFGGQRVAFDDMLSWIDGTAGDDQITGTGGADQIRVFAGDDTVHGGGGLDLVRGGLGADRLLGEVGEDRLYGEADNDTLDGGEGADLLRGGAGDDVLIGTGEDLLIDGGEGRDLARLDFSASQDDLEFRLADAQAGVVVGGTEVISIEQVDLLGGQGDELFVGGAYNDSLQGGAGDDSLIGGGGEDLLAGGSGADVIDGGEGEDTVVFSGRRSDYDVVRQDDGAYLVTDLRADTPDGTALVSRVETARFSDGVMALDGVLEPNRPPVAHPDAASVSEDGVAQIDVRANDLDPDLDPLSTVFDLTGLRGDAQVSDDGQLIFRPGEAFQHLREGQTAQEQITYVIEDGAGGSADGVLTITVTGVNDRPIASADGVVVNEDGVTGNLWATLLGNDQDLDADDQLTIVEVDPAGVRGGVTFDPETRTLTYAATGHDGLNPGEVATDAFTYTVRDSAGAASVATVTVTIHGQADEGVLIGAEGTDTLVGGGQAERIEGRGGDDLLLGAGGADTLLGGGGADTLWIGAEDMATGGTGSDVFVPEASATGAVITDFAVGAAGDTLDVSAFVASAVDPFGMGRLKFQAHDTGAALVFDADGPSGGAAPVTVAVFQGLTALEMSTARIVAFDAAGGPVAANPSPINARVGGAISETLVGGSGRDLLLGMDGTDMLRGGGGGDVIDGGDGWDVLFGDAGDDALLGGLGADALNGGLGLDTLDGGAGADVLTGGAGADRFVFEEASGGDVIVDFEAGPGAGDVLDFIALAHITSFADVQARLSSDSTGAAVIDLGEGSSLTLRGVPAARLHEDDFLFASSARSSSLALGSDGWAVA